MSQENEQRLRFRDAMASLSAAVNIVTTDGPAGRCGITATAVCSVTDTPPTLLVCINRNSAMNPVFQENRRLCVNVLNHEQELMARHFAGMTGVSMEDRFRLKEWQLGALGQPVLRNTLASLEGEIEQIQSIGTHQMYLVQIKQIALSEAGNGLGCCSSSASTFVTAPWLMPKRRTPSWYRARTVARSRIPPAPLISIRPLSWSAIMLTFSTVAPVGAQPVEVLTHFIPTSTAISHTRRICSSLR